MRHGVLYGNICRVNRHRDEKQALIGLQALPVLGMGDASGKCTIQWCALVQNKLVNDPPKKLNKRGTLYSKLYNIHYISYTTKCKAPSLLAKVILNIKFKISACEKKFYFYFFLVFCILVFCEKKCYLHLNIIALSELEYILSQGKR